MRGNYIDFISSYCDSWCERCAFTDRCSTHAIEVAVEMCGGDVSSGMELAVGAPPPRTVAERARRDRFREVLDGFCPSDAELARAEREGEAREERVDGSPLTTAAEAYALLARDWLNAHADLLPMSSDPKVAAALETVGRDVYLIAAKLHRALSGFDEFQRGEGCDEDPVQNDWNGSAKVALVSIVRSTEAWELLAHLTRDADARHVAERLVALRTSVEQTFPDVWHFVRPGFDGEARWPWQKRRRKP